MKHKKPEKKEILPLSQEDGYTHFEEALDMCWNEAIDKYDIYHNEVIVEKDKQIAELKKQIDCKSGIKDCSLNKECGFPCYRHLYNSLEICDKQITVLVEALETITTTDDTIGNFYVDIAQEALKQVKEAQDAS